MITNILIVCIGNICRSPMAEVLFQKLAKTNISRDVQVSSVGIHALEGHLADDFAQEVIQGSGISLNSHRATQLGPDAMSWADIILVMENNQKSYLEKKYPFARGKIFRLGHWENTEIQDPYKKGKDQFLEAFSLIEQGSKSWIRKIADMS